MAGIDRVETAIRADIETKIDFLEKRLKDGLADMVVTVLAERTCNTHVLSAGLPRKTKTAEHRYQFIRRFVKNKNITCHQVMCPYVQELVIKTTQNGQTVILQMDQSKLVDRFYGTKALVEWCHNHRFAYRIRIKGHLLFHHQHLTKEERDRLYPFLHKDCAF